MSAQWLRPWLLLRFASSGIAARMQSDFLNEQAQGTENSSTQIVRPKAQPGVEMQAMKGSYIVGLKPEGCDRNIRKLCKKGSGITCRFRGNNSAGAGAYVVVSAPEQKLQKRLTKLGSGAVKLAEQDVFEQFMVFFGGGTAQPGGPHWGLERIGVPARRTGTGQGVHVYILDSGLNVGHEDFEGRAVNEIELSRRRRVLSSQNRRRDLDSCARAGNGGNGGNVRQRGSGGVGGNADCGSDNQGHGTHTSGTIVGRRNGVAPGATIHMLQVLESSPNLDIGSYIQTALGSKASIVVQALNWINTNAQLPAVGSMSLGMKVASSAYEPAINALTQRGISVVVGAGNNRIDSCVDNAFTIDAVITVGATDNKDTLAKYSSYGKCVDIWAPGTDILSTWMGSSTAEKAISGTSMACPHVSGAVALLLEQNNAMAPDQVRQALKNNAQHGAVHNLGQADTNDFLQVT